MTAVADKENYKTAQFSAKDIWLHDFKDIYVEIFRQCDVMACLAAVSRKVVQQMGFEYEKIPEGMRFIDYLSQIDSVDAITKREIRTLLRKTFLDNPLMDNNFALACSMLTGSILGYPILEEQNKELLMAWLEGDRSINCLSCVHWIFIRAALPNIMPGICSDHWRNWSAWAVIRVCLSRLMIWRF